MRQLRRSGYTALRLCEDAQSSAIPRAETDALKWTGQYLPSATALSTEAIRPDEVSQGRCWSRWGRKACRTTRPSATRRGLFLKRHSMCRIVRLYIPVVRRRRKCFARRSNHEAVSKAALSRTPVAKRLVAEGTCDKLKDRPVDLRSACSCSLVLCAYISVYWIFLPSCHPPIPWAVSGPLCFGWRPANI